MALLYCTHTVLKREKFNVLSIAKGTELHRQIKLMVDQLFCKSVGLHTLKQLIEMVIQLGEATNNSAEKGSITKQNP